MGAPISFATFVKPYLTRCCVSFGSDETAKVVCNFKEKNKKTKFLGLKKERRIQWKMQKKRDKNYFKKLAENRIKHLLFVSRSKYVVSTWFKKKWATIGLQKTILYNTTRRFLFLKQGDGNSYLNRSYAVSERGSTSSFLMVLLLSWWTFSGNVKKTSFFLFNLRFHFSTESKTEKTFLVQKTTTFFSF